MAAFSTCISLTEVVVEPRGPPLDFFDFLELALAEAVGLFGSYVGAMDGDSVGDFVRVEPPFPTFVLL